MAAKGDKSADGTGRDAREAAPRQILSLQTEAEIDDLLGLLTEDSHETASLSTRAAASTLIADLCDGPRGTSAAADALRLNGSGAKARAGWAERSATRAHQRLVETRKRAFSGPRLLGQIELDSVAELGMVANGVVDLEEASQGQIVRAAVNELQHCLLTAEPRADVLQLALERLMSATCADRVCAFVNRTGEDGGSVQVLDAEITVSPGLSLLDRHPPAVAYDELLPGLLEQLSAGEPFSASIEFLPKAAVEHLAAQAVQMTMMLPLFVGGALYGFLRLDHCDEARLWSEAETGILLSAAGSISAAIERQILLDELDRQANKDGLTGLANRRHLYARLEQETTEARLNARPLALLMLDIDDFKHLNDTYGHLAGDEVLRSIGRLLLSETRDADLAGRYGGEEFCLVLSETAFQERTDPQPRDVDRRRALEERAVALAERLRREIAAQRLHLGPDGAVVQVTVSIGVASSPDGQLAAEELVERADTALYAAKHAGKDRIEIFEDGAQPDARGRKRLLLERKPVLVQIETRVPKPARKARSRRARTKEQGADTANMHSDALSRLEVRNTELLNEVERVDGLAPSYSIMQELRRRDGAAGPRPGGSLSAPVDAFSVLQGLVTAIDNVDSYTRQHSQEVASFAEAIALTLGLPQDVRRTLAMAALLHDVGKIGVPVEVLRKPGGLTADEFEAVKQHAALGGIITQRIPDLDKVQAAVISHHEHFDGSGYPGGMSGDAIPLLGRILAIADACSAMITDRPYRAALSEKAAVRELERCAGSQFDPILVEVSRGVLFSPAARQQSQ